MATIGLPRGWLNPHLPSYRKDVGGERVPSVSAFFGPKNYGSFGDNAQYLSDGYKRYGFGLGSFRDGSGKDGGGPVSSSSAFQDISAFIKNPSNMGSFGTAILGKGGEINPEILGNLDRSGAIFMAWAKRNGAVDENGKVDKDKAFNLARQVISLHDKRKANSAVSNPAKKAVTPSVVKEAAKAQDPLGEWYRFLAKEHRTPWHDDEILGRAKTTETKYAESTYNAVVSERKAAFQNFKNSLLKFNQNVRNLSQAVSRSAKAASPRGRALLKRDIEYLTDFRNVVAGMMQDFSIVLREPQKQTVKQEKKKSPVTAPTKRPVQTTPEPVAAPPQQAQVQAPVTTPAPAPTQAQAPAASNTPPDYRDYVYDSMAANRYAASQPRPYWETGVRF